MLNAKFFTKNYNSFLSLHPGESRCNDHYFIKYVDALDVNFLNLDLDTPVQPMLLGIFRNKGKPLKFCCRNGTDQRLQFFITRSKFIQSNTPPSNNKNK